MFSNVFGRSFGRWTLVAFAGVTTAACSSHQARPIMWLQGSVHNMVTIRNDNWLDADVFEYRLGSRYRIGTAPGLGSSTILLPRNLVHNRTGRVLVEPVGPMATYKSDQMRVSPAQRIELGPAIPTLQADDRG